jgi:hypothetical protein
LPKKLYDNLRRFEAVNKPEGFGAEVDVEQMNYFLLSRQSLSVSLDLKVPFSSNVLEFSFISVTESEVCNAVMSINSNAALVLVFY